MTHPEPATFLQCSREAFSFLEPSRFVPTFESTPIYDAVTFTGRNVALTISWDRRDSCVDFSLRTNSARHLGFDTYLVKYHGYRGSLAELRDSSASEAWQRDIQCYARALQQLAPELVRDAPLIPAGND